jgi:hypothetical protein
MLRAGADWAERSRNWPRPVRNKQDRPVVVMMRSCRRGGGMSGSGAVAQGDEVAPAVRLFRPVTGHYPPEATFGPETGLAAGGRCQPTVHRSFSLVAGRPPSCPAGKFLRHATGRPGASGRPGAGCGGSSSLARVCGTGTPPPEEKEGGRPGSPRSSGAANRLKRSGKMINGASCEGNSWPV